MVSSRRVADRGPLIYSAGGRCPFNWRGARVVIRGPSRKRIGAKRHVGSNPTLSAGLSVLARPHLSTRNGEVA